VDGAGDLSVLGLLGAAEGIQDPARPVRADVGGDQARPRAAASPLSSRAFPPGPAQRSSQSPSGPVSPTRDRASTASWLASSWTAIWPEAVNGAGSPPASRRPYGDQRVGCASSPAGPAVIADRSVPGVTASTTSGRRLPAARASSISAALVTGVALGFL